MGVRRIGSAAATSLVSVLVVACAADPIVAPEGPGTPAVVLEVVDGDTLVLEDPGRTVVRLIGVNAPERDECLTVAAAAELAALAGPGEAIRVVPHGTDRFDRTLAEVFTAAGSANEALVEAGMALSMAGEGSLTDRLRAAETRAREAGRGLWDPGACGSRSHPDVAILSLDADPPGPDGEPGSDERVAIANRGSSTIDLSGWVVRDESSIHRFRLPAGTVLGPGASISVSSGCRTEPGVLAWCSGPVWNNAGDTAFLLTPEGAIASWLRHGP